MMLWVAKTDIDEHVKVRMIFGLVDIVTLDGYLLKNNYAHHCAVGDRMHSSLTDRMNWYLKSRYPDSIFSFSTRTTASYSFRLFYRSLYSRICNRIHTGIGVN